MQRKPKLHYMPRGFEHVDVSRVKGLMAVLKKFDAQEKSFIGAERKFAIHENDPRQDYVLSASRKQAAHSARWRAVILARLEVQYKRLTYLIDHASALGLGHEEIKQLQSIRRHAEKQFKSEHREMLSDKNEAQEPL